MKAVAVMYDSLNRRFLSPYGNTWVRTPNFERLSQKAAVFDCFYAGSLPCMPARRELHTGRYNFLHRGWSPLEPFDESAPEMLKQRGVYSYLITDHLHYWGSGGGTYHGRFAGHEFIRGQEGDAWAAAAAGFSPERDSRAQDALNRMLMQEENRTCHARVFQAGARFIEENARADNWFLQLEYYDPHEPFFVSERFKALYGPSPAGCDWPRYAPLAAQNAADIEAARLNYAALVTMCDEYLGRILDLFDKHDLWRDTMLLVNTDHGYFFGERGFVAKNYMPPYDEIVRLPFFLWDPRAGREGGRCRGLAQTIDIPVTLLAHFGAEKGAYMQGADLRPLASGERSEAREAGLFGYFGKHVCVTDGRRVYMRAARRADNAPLYSYTLMPQHIRGAFSPAELSCAEDMLCRDFAFTRGAPALKIPFDAEADARKEFPCASHMAYGDLLFDTAEDPGEERPLRDAAAEAYMAGIMREEMKRNEAPPEQFARMGL